MKKFLLWPWLVMVGWAAPAVGPLDLTPAQCKEHQLPPFSVHLDTTGTNLEASLFPERGTYLRLSGPPGGVLLFELLPCKDVKKLLQTRFPKGVLGKPGTFKLSGKTCATQGLVDGKSQARTRWCAVVLEPEGLVALFGVGSISGPPDDCLSVLQHQSFQSVVKSFRLGATSIGSATMRKDGTIVLMLRAEDGKGTAGDAMFTYPKGHKEYDKMLEHLGGLKPDQTKPVPPWPDKK